MYDATSPAPPTSFPLPSHPDTGTHTPGEGGGGPRAAKGGGPRAEGERGGQRPVVLRPAALVHQHGVRCVDLLEQRLPLRVLVRVVVQGLGSGEQGRVICRELSTDGKLTTKMGTGIF